MNPEKITQNVIRKEVKDKKSLRLKQSIPAEIFVLLKIRYQKHCSILHQTFSYVSRFLTTN